MKSEDKNIDSIFREDLNNFSPHPPDRVWERIEKDLAGKKRKSFLPVLFKIASAIILGIGIIAAVWKMVHTASESEFPYQEKENLAIDPEINQEVIDKSSVESGTKTVLGRKSEHRNILSVDSKNYVSDSTSTPVTPVKEEIIRPKEELIAFADSLTDMPPMAQKKESVAPNNQNLSMIIKKNKEDQVESQNNLLAVLSDEEDETKERKVKWFVGGRAGPQYMNWNVPENQEHTVNSVYSKIKKDVVTYAGGIDLQIEPVSRFSIQSGIYYSKISTEVTSIQWLGEEALDRSLSQDWADYLFEGEYVVFNSPNGRYEDIEEGAKLNNQIIKGNTLTNGREKATEIYEYIEIPLILSYRILDRKLGVSCSGGIWTNFLIGNKVVIPASTTNEGEIESENKSMNSRIYSGSVGLGFEYPIASKLLFNMEPVFKYYLSSVNSGTGIDVHPFSFGLMTGLRYSF